MNIIGFPHSEGYLGINSSPFFGGRHYFVCNRSGIVNGDGKTPKRPFSTIAAALKAASNSPTDDGCIIHVGEGHLEYVTAADAWSDLASKGVTIRSYGPPGVRGKFVWKTAAGAQVIMDKAGFWLDNLDLDLFDADNDLTVTCAIDVTAAGCGITRCYIRTGTVAARGAAIGIRVSTGGTNFQFGDGMWSAGLGNEIVGAAAVAAIGVNVIKVLNAVDGVKVIGNRIAAPTSAAAVGPIALYAAATNLCVARNIIHNNAAGSTACITGFAGATGTIADNRLRNMTDASVAHIVTPGNTQLFENYGVNDNGQTGILIGTPSV